MASSYGTWIACVILLPCCLTTLFCPDVAELGSSLLLTCVRSTPVNVTIFFSLPDKSNIACYQDKCFIQGSRVTATVNTTHITLQVNSVQQTDGGTWSCGPEGEQNPCRVTVFQTPSCHISSDRSTAELELNEDITLTVNIIDYYCVQSFDFLLQTGDTTEQLKKNVIVKNVASDIFNSTFNVTDSHIGVLKLFFGCHNKSIRCSGVSAILRKTPSCNITGALDTVELKPDETITLSVYIEGYSCSSNYGYLLRIGDVTHNLSGGDNGMYEGNTTIKLTDSHFGSVYVNFTCNDVSRNITCRGITSLDVNRGCHVHDSIGIVSLAVGIGIGMAVVITLVTVVICLLMKRKGICLKGCMTPSSSNTIRANHPEAQARPGSVDQNGGDGYEMPRNNYEHLHRNVNTANSYERLTPYETIEPDN